MAEAIQKGWEATVGGDVNAMRSLYEPGSVCHVPGRGAHSGDFHGFDEMMRWFSGLLEDSGGTFREDSLVVLADDSWAFQMTKFHAERKGRKIEQLSMNAYRLRAGRIAEVWGFFETHSWNEFWG